jgi:hypothetical protein
MHRSAILSPTDMPPDDEGSVPFGLGRFPADDETHLYRVEMWSRDGTSFEQLVATSVSAAIGFAAYYAAIREYPGCVLLLKQGSRVITRWSAPTH